MINLGIVLVESCCIISKLRFLNCALMNIQRWPSIDTVSLEVVQTVVVHYGRCIIKHTIWKVTLYLLSHNLCQIIVVLVIQSQSLQVESTLFLLFLYHWWVCQYLLLGLETFPSFYNHLLFAIYEDYIVVNFLICVFIHLSKVLDRCVKGECSADEDVLCYIFVLELVGRYNDLDLHQVEGCILLALIQVVVNWLNVLVFEVTDIVF